jgi:predicted RNA polymerase sigma factor
MLGLLISRKGAVTVFRACWPKQARAAKPAQAYEMAIGLERDPAVRDFLQRRQSALQP